MKINICKTIVVGLLSTLLMAQPASARRFRLFGIPSFGGGETIDLVYDLPDRDPFVKDGNNLDVGYLNGKTKSGYVLYYGSSYRLLDQSDISVLTRALGFNPTAKHRAAYLAEHGAEIAAAEAEVKAERAKKDAMLASGRMIERAPGESNADYSVRVAAFMKARHARQESAKSASLPDPATASASQNASGRSGSGVVFIVLLLLGIGFAKRRKLFELISASLAHSNSARGANGGSSVADDRSFSFDQRVARELDALRTRQNEPDSPVGAPAGPAPTVRGFGRKLA